MNSKQASLQIPQYKGEILMCEDGEINQNVIKFQLTRLGIEVIIANNGEEGVNIIKNRKQTGQKPFDLILMDIYMPVMGGLDASKEIVALGCKTPIVALTADSEINQRENLELYGISGFLNKPVVDAELWDCLSNYFTLLGYMTEDEKRRADEEAERQTRLLSGFVKRNQTTAADIRAALKANDIKLAHRLAHTLRGLAGLMKQTALSEAAHAVEYALADMKMDKIDSQMDTLEERLTAVLDELMPIYGEKNKGSENVAYEASKAKATFEKLKGLLEADNAESMDMIGELKQIPGTGELIGQIEEYEFETALETLANLINTQRG